MTNKGVPIKKIILGLTLFFAPLSAFAFLADGGAGWAQLTYLTKILAENIKQYQQLKTLSENGKSQFQYFRQINQGLENSLGLLKSIPIRDNAVLGEIQSFERAYRKVQDLYGSLPIGRERELYRLHDQTAAEGIKMASNVKEYTLKQEENAEKISWQGRVASPKGAARMNTEVSAQILHTLNQLLKINGQLLKIHSEQFALTNKGEKDAMKSYNKINIDLKHEMTNFNGDFRFPQF